MALPSEAQTATCTLTEGALDVRLDVGERMTIMREGPNIGVRSSTGEACALVKRSEVEDLSVNGTPDRDVLVVDLEGGPILGGAEVEVGPDEIELIIDLGAGQRDRLVVRAPSGGGTLVAGAGGIALNNDRDADILLAGVEQLVLEGRDGDDRLSGAGGRGTGAAADRPLILQGGSGNDSLIGGRAADRLLGGPGRDDLAGGSGDDVLAGGSMADREAGGDGDDRFEQGRKPNGGDVLFGQAGRDTVSYAARSDPISVTIGIGADDGAVGSVETDRVGSDVEVVLGGSSSDVLIAPLMSLVGYELDGARAPMCSWVARAMTYFAADAAPTGCCTHARIAACGSTCAPVSPEAWESTACSAFRTCWGRASPTCSTETPVTTHWTAGRATTCCVGARAATRSAAVAATTCCWVTGARTRSTERAARIGWKADRGVTRCAATPAATS